MPRKSPQKRKSSRRKSSKRCQKHLSSKRKGSYQRFVKCQMKAKSLQKYSPQERMKRVAAMWRKR